MCRCHKRMSADCTNTHRSNIMMEAMQVVTRNKRLHIHGAHWHSSVCNLPPTRVADGRCGCHIWAKPSHIEPHKRRGEKLRIHCEILNTAPQTTMFTSSSLDSTHMYAVFNHKSCNDQISSLHCCCANLHNHNLDETSVRFSWQYTLPQDQYH